jgi:iron(III) transport system ATP-binding protein
MNTLEIQNLTKHYPDGDDAAVNNVTFGLEHGGILALVGPSGSGKTTALRLIAGLERPDSGTIRLNGRTIASDSVFVEPEQRGVGMVFQDYALFPHLTVFENVAFGLRKQSSAQSRQTVGEMLHLVGLLPFSRRYPHELSGGERQRVALARALAPRPLLVLMDEPFSSLDADLRAEVSEHVRLILKTMRATVIFVTHDQEEALYMGDRLAVLHAGRLEQIGTPEEIFHGAGTRFVAEFMGGSDFLTGEMTPDGVHTAIGSLRQKVDVAGSNLIEIALRADDVDFQPHADGNGVILERFFRGAFNVYRLRLDSGEVVHALKEHTELIAPGTRIKAYISTKHDLAVFQSDLAVSRESGENKE